MKHLDLRQGYENLLKLGSGWKYQKPPRFSINRAAGDMKRVKELLFLPKDRIFRFQPGELRPHDNSVEKLHINMIGGQGSGKGHTARWIARWCWEYYQENQARIIEAAQDDTPLSPDIEEWGSWVAQGLNCVTGHHFEMSADPWFYAVRDPELIKELLTHGLDQEAVIQVVHAEDLTSTMDKMGRKYTADAGSTWFKIRHKLRDATDRQQGLIVGILGLHRFHGVPPPFTTDIDLMIFKSSSSNPHDKRTIKQYVGQDGINFLEMLEQERRNDPMFKGYGIWYHKGETGVWYNPFYPGSDPFKPLHYVETEETGDTPMSSNTGAGAAQREKQPVQVGDYIVEPLGSTEDQEFREEVIQHLPTHMKRSDPALAERDKLILRYSIAGETQNTIAAQVDVTPSRVGQIQREIKAGPMGYAGEDAYHERRPELEFIGGNAPEPDFIDHEARKVISFKTYDEPALRDTTTWICDRVGKEEMRYSQEHGYGLEMAIYEMSQGRFFWYRYTHKDQEKDDIIDQDSGGAEQDPEESHDIVDDLSELEKDLNPLAIPAAQDILKKTLEAARDTVDQLGGDPREILALSLAHSIKQLEAVGGSGKADPGITQACITYLRRYKEART